MLPFRYAKFDMPQTTYTAPKPKTFISISVRLEQSQRSTVFAGRSGNIYKKV